MADYDVLIAGGGPAGCATAISLRDFAPELRVCAAEPGVRHPRFVGETLSPQALIFLKHLGLRDRFERDGHERAFRTQSAWGVSRLVPNEFLYGVHQIGWRLDRTRFEDMLVNAAVDRGVEWRSEPVVSAAYADHRWTVQLQESEPVTARFVVDATGRRAVLCRKLNIVSVKLDRLIACTVRMQPAAAKVDLTVEAFADGWWYATSLPNGERILACMTDNDIVRREGFAQLDRLMLCLGETEFVREAAIENALVGQPQLFAAGSFNRAITGNLPFLAVGDAASSFDPISSQGIAKALRAGVFASYGIADLLVRGDRRGVARYLSFVADEFAAYQSTLRDYYRQETRWTDRPFWQRRHAMA